jgi:hypothetical protein
MKKIFVILFAGLLVSAGLQAQKVYMRNNKVILDLTEAAGMPAGVTTNVSKTAMFYSYGKPSSTTALWRSENQHGGSINATVFQKLEVAPKDMNKAGAIGGTGTMTMNWVEAFNGCIESTYDGGRWRLPTQRELQLIYIFKEALDTALSRLTPNGTGNALSSECLSATERYADTIWSISSSSRTNNLTTKDESHRVRCVREVTP